MRLCYALPVVFKPVQAILENHSKENNGYCIREQKRFHVRTLFSFLTFESLLSNFFLETGFPAESESRSEKNFAIQFPVSESMNLDYLTKTKKGNNQDNEAYSRIFPAKNESTFYFF